METVRLALHAMNTRFELVLHGGDVVALRAAGEEAFAEIARIERLLSAFRPTSEIAHVNAHAADRPVQVSPEVFLLLVDARRLWEQTARAFDVTVGPLMRCWGFHGGSGAPADAAAINRAMKRVGFQHVDLDVRHRTVSFRRPAMAVDLGGIGKGYAIDQAVEILRDGGVCSGLLHGGTSTVYAIGSPPGLDAWRVSLAESVEGCPEGAGAPAAVSLQDGALSVSSPSEKCFRVDETTYGHVIDPRSGWPVRGAALAMVRLPTATAADAWSTALLVMGGPGIKRLEQGNMGGTGLVIGEDGQCAGTVPMATH